MSDSFVTPVASVHGIFQARILERVAISFSRDLPNPGIEPAAPVLAGGFFTTEPLGKPLGVSTCYIIKGTSSLCPGVLAQSF